MRTVAVAGLVLLVASLALAGGNPDVKGYIDFDPPNRVHQMTPEPYTAVQAYVCFGDLEMGLTGACFRINDVLSEYPDAIAVAGFVTPLDGIVAGDIFTGITVTSTQCEPPPDVCVGYVEMFYLGGECCVELLDHPEYPRWVIDCNDPPQVDYYCVLSHGSIGGPTCPDGDCQTTPAEGSTWGAIKSLYR